MTQTMEATYTLIMLNAQGASEETGHDTKAAVRRQIRTWEARKMTARVIVDGFTVYDGPALKF